MERQFKTRRVARTCAIAVILTYSLLSNAVPAFALSELRPEAGGQPATGGSATERDTLDPDQRTVEPDGIPMPGPLIDKGIEKGIDGDVAVPSGEPADADGDPETGPVQPVEVLTDISKVPEPVARMRQLIVEAAASGNIERLRALLGKGPTETEVGAGDSEDDAVTVLKSLSGDPEGIEILAILLDVLSTGFVHLDAGTPEEMYVWPYFAAKPLASLTPPEKVDLFRLVTAGDFAEMQEFGSYNFYRVGITPDGQWKFFVAGD